MQNKHHYAEVDLIKEFRLRRWARKHYVPAEERNLHWHPIVLDEMAFKEQEIKEMESKSQVSQSYVPLVPHHQTPHIKFRASTQLELKDSQREIAI